MRCSIEGCKLPVIGGGTVDGHKVSYCVEHIDRIPLSAQPLMTQTEVDGLVQEMIDIVKPRGAEGARGRRLLAYMMHPLGSGTNREYNRRSACHWQAVIQEAHPEWLVLAPWIGLSGAWSEARRELGMQTDFATIDVCDIGVIAGPLDGPASFVSTEFSNRVYEGVSPGMADELRHFNKPHNVKKEVFDLRREFKIELPPWHAESLGGRVEPRVPMPPRFRKFETVLVENKPGGLCRVKDVEEQAPGCYRYLIERTETFFAHEQALAKAEHPLEVPPLPSLKNL